MISEENQAMQFSPADLLNASKCITKRPQTVGSIRRMLQETGGQDPKIKLGDLKFNSALSSGIAKQGFQLTTLSCFLVDFTC